MCIIQTTTYPQCWAQYTHTLICVTQFNRRQKRSANLAQSCPNLASAHIHVDHGGCLCKTHPRKNTIQLHCQRLWGGDFFDVLEEGVEVNWYGRSWTNCTNLKVLERNGDRNLTEEQRFLVTRRGWFEGEWIGRIRRVDWRNKDWVGLVEKARRNKDCEGTIDRSRYKALEVQSTEKEHNTSSMLQRSLPTRNLVALPQNNINGPEDRGHLEEIRGTANMATTQCSNAIIGRKIPIISTESNTTNQNKDDILLYSKYQTTPPGLTPSKPRGISSYTVQDSREARKNVVEPDDYMSYSLAGLRLPFKKFNDNGLHEADQVAQDVDMIQQNTAQVTGLTAINVCRVPPHLQPNSLPPKPSASTYYETLPKQETLDKKNATECQRDESHLTMGTTFNPQPQVHGDDFTMRQSAGNENASFEEEEKDLNSHSMNESRRRPEFTEEKRQKLQNKKPRKVRKMEAIALESGEMEVATKKKKRRHPRENRPSKMERVAKKLKRLEESGGSEGQKQQLSNDRHLEDGMAPVEDNGGLLNYEPNIEAQQTISSVVKLETSMGMNKEGEVENGGSIMVAHAQHGGVETPSTTSTFNNSKDQQNQKEQPRKPYLYDMVKHSDGWHMTIDLTDD